MLYNDPRRPKGDPRPFQKADGFWYVLFYQRGKNPKQKWVSTGIQTKYFTDWKAHVPDSVNNLCTDWGRLWRDDKYTPWDDDAPGRVTAAQAVERYLAQHGGAEETLKSYRTTLEPFVATLSPGLPVSEIQPRHVRHFIEQPQLSGSTPNAYFNRLRSFFGYCLEKRWVYEDPTGSIARPPEASSSARSVFLPHELDRILIAAAADVVQRPQRTICLFAYELAVVTGMRVGELCSRTWADVDLHRNVIRVDNQPACDFTPKNEASKRIIPLFPRAKRIIASLQERRISEDSTEPLFLAPRHRSSSNPFLSADWLSRRFTQHRTDAGLPDGTIHSLRHTFITFILALGIPESKAMAMTGHVKHETIARYTHIVDQLLQEAPDAALARYLPGFQADRQPRLLRLIASFMADQEVETEIV